MIRRTCNFINLENGSNWDNSIQIINMETIVNTGLKKEYYAEEVEKILSYFEKMITIYPEVLKDHQIEQDSKRLIAYCKEKGITYKDTYSYIHSQKSDDTGIDKAVIGLKVSNLKYYYGDMYAENIIDIAYYDYSYSKQVMNKKKLRFKLIKNKIFWGHLLIEDSSVSHLYESRTLELLKPKTYIKI